MYLFKQITDSYPKKERTLEGLKGLLLKDRDKPDLSYELLSSRNVILVFSKHNLIGVIEFVFEKDEITPPQATNDPDKF